MLLSPVNNYHLTLPNPQLGLLGQHSQFLTPTPVLPKLTRSSLAVGRAPNLQHPVLGVIVHIELIADKL